MKHFVTLDYEETVYCTLFVINGEQVANEQFNITVPVTKITDTLNGIIAKKEREGYEYVSSRVFKNTYDYVNCNIIVRRVNGND